LAKTPLEATEDFNKQVEFLFGISNPLRFAQTLRDMQSGSPSGPNAVPTTRMSPADNQNIRWVPTAPFVAPLMDIVNDPQIVLTPEDVAIINDPEVVMTPSGEVARRMEPVQTMPSGRSVIRKSGQFSRYNLMPNFTVPKKRVRKSRSKYRVAYKAAFRKIKPSMMTKAGKWKKGGFKAAVKASHKAARKATKQKA